MLVIILTIYTVFERNRVVRLTIAAGSQTGESYQLSQALAKVVARHRPKIQIQVLETEGTIQSLEVLQSGKAQMVAAQADIPAPEVARLVTFLFPDLFQLVVTEKSGIGQVPDLQGKRVGLPPKGGGQYASFLFLADHYRLNPEDPLFLPMPSETIADEAFRKKQVDAIFRVRPPGNRSILELVQKHGGRLIAIDQATAMKIRKPTIDTAFVPKGAYQGSPPIPATDLPTVAVQRLLLAHRDVDPEVVKEITAVMYEHRQDLMNEMPLAAYITPPNGTAATSMPIHPGAQAYYDKDKPSFFQENADFLGLILSLILLGWSGLSWAKSRLEQGRKDEADGFIRQVTTLMNKPRTATTRQELRKILATAVNALIEEEISLEAFQSFRVVWQIAMDDLRDQEAIALQQASRSRMSPPPA
ncbi:hypothetical protein BST81_15160 [Leptolyngbya sp. 'hensonii']|nr:hypothetical protein BST81_15160 [Leptolyngbya sp. 'hensonii']